MRFELAGHVIGVAATKLGGVALSLLLVIVSARLLEPAVFGVFSFFIALASISSSFVSGGFTHYWTRELVAKDSRDDQSDDVITVDFSDAFYGTVIWVVMTGILVSLISILIWPVLEGRVLYGPLLLFAAVLLLAPVSIVAGVMRVRGRVVLGELPGACLIPMSGLLLLLALTLINQKIDSMLVLTAYIAALLVAGAISLFLLRMFSDIGLRHISCSKFEFLPWIRRFLPFCFLSVVGVLSTQLATVLVGVIEGPDFVASYRIADRISAVVSMPLVILNVVVSGVIAKSIYDKELAKTKYLMDRARLAALAVGGVISLFLILFGDLLITVFFGESYSKSSYGPMVVLIVANWINVGFGSVGLVLLMAGREKEVLKQQSISIALLVVALIPLTVWFGIIGSSVAVLMSTFYWNFRLSLSLRRFFSRPDGEM